jgi:hypothetical protein
MKEDKPKFLGVSKKLEKYNPQKKKSNTVRKTQTVKPVVTKPYSILIWINTYNRPDDLDNLLHDISKNKRNHFSISIIVIDDHSELLYSDVIKKYSGILNITYNRMVSNHGKKKYWKLCNYAINQIMSMGVFDYYIKLDDDLRLIDDFFARCINIWNNIKDTRKICLNFRLDSREGKKVWTDTLPTIVNYNGTSVYISQWVDMDFFVTREFFRVLRYRINRIPVSRWLYNPNMSSGVGRDISRRLHQMGYNLYLTTETLVEHNESVSVMNQHERKRNPLDTKPLVHNSRYGL